MTAFTLIGMIVVALLAAVGCALVCAWLYYRLIESRFSMILFRKGERRLSLASWYNARLMNDEYFEADDWVIGERPFYLSYRFSGQRRVFIMAGTMGGRRAFPIKGKHPEEGSAA